MMAAVFYNAKDCIEHILTEGVELQAADLYGRTIIHIAAHTGNKELLEYEHFTACDYNAKDWRGRTPFQYAVARGHIECADYLIDQHVADINLRDRFGFNSLHIAAEAGNLEMVQWLLGKGINIVDERNGYPPMILALRRHHMKIVDFFLERDSGAIRWTKSDMNLLHLISQLGIVELLPKLIAAGGFDPNALDGYGFNALHYAVAHGHTPFVAELLKLPGIDIFVHHTSGRPDDPTENTPMFLGIIYGHLAEVKMLFDRDDKSKLFVDNNQGTTLHVASQWARSDVCFFLLEKKVDRRSLDGDGKRAHELCGGSTAGYLSYMIKTFKDPNAKADGGGGCCEVA
jgi:ankyrin repeat protein